MRAPGAVLLLAVVGMAGCGTAPPTAQGVIEADEQTLAFAVPGRVVEVLVDEGQAIAADTVVARIDGREQQVALLRAEAEVALARAQLAQRRAAARPEVTAAAAARVAAARATRTVAEAEQTRHDDLLRAGTGSLQARDAAVAAAARAVAEDIAATQDAAALAAGSDAPAIAVAEAQVAVAEASVAAARDAVAKTSLSSPPGPRTVRHVHRRPGELAPVGAAVLTVADLARPYLDAFVPQSVAARLQIGAPAVVQIDGLPPQNGTVERLGERLEYTPRFLFGPEDRPHLMVRVRVRLAGPAPAAGVPADVTFPGL